MKDDSGQGMVEYAFILALVVIAAIVLIGLFGEALLAMYQNIVNSI